jgi:hypothetical protein
MLSGVIFATILERLFITGKSNAPNFLCFANIEKIDVNKNSKITSFEWSQLHSAKIVYISKVSHLSLEEIVSSAILFLLYLKG